MSRRAGRLALATLAVLALAARAAEPAAPSCPAPGPALLAGINALRAAGGPCGARGFAPAGPLAWNATLAAVAAGHAQALALRGTLSHGGADGSLGGDRLKRAGYAWQRWGENLAAGSTEPEALLALWRDSPVHCALLREPALHEAGLACAPAAAGGPYWVLMLATPR